MFHSVVVEFTNLDDALAFFEHAEATNVKDTGIVLEGSTVTIECIYFGNFVRILGYMNENNVVSVHTTNGDE